MFSYHLYAAVSKRCASLGPATQTTAAAALSEEWLSRPYKIDAFYTGLRNRFVPGKPVWITETADAACGGNPWASTSLDTFRYLDQLCVAPFSEQSLQGGSCFAPRRLKHRWIER